MIIEDIKVKDFASYSSCGLPLRSLGKIISICGPTGTGKTTLLIDAVTAALFGRAYGQSKKESKKWVIAPSAPEAKIELDFCVGENRYQLRRLIKRRGQGAVELLRKKEEGEERLATGEREVEARIEKIIGLDYITFLNTIAVRQGQVDELLRARPQERREVFLRAFGVDFTKYKEKAREKRDKVKVALSEAKGKIEVLRDQISKLPELINKLQNARKTYRRIRDEIGKTQKNWSATRRELERFRTLHARIVDKLARISEKEEMARALENQLQQKQGERDFLKKESQRLEELKEKLQKNRRTLAVYSEVSPTVIRIDATKKELERDLRDIQKLQKRVSELHSLHAQLKKARRANRLFPVTEERRRRMEEKWRNTSNALSQTKGKLSEIKKAMEVLERAIKTGEEKCPVCMRPLGTGQAKVAHSHLKFEERGLLSQMRKLQREEAKLERSVEKIRNRRDLLQREGAKQESLERQLLETKGLKKELPLLEREAARKLREVEKMEKKVRKKLGRVLTGWEVEEKVEQLTNQIRIGEEEIEQLRELPGKLRSCVEQIARLEKEAERLRLKIERAAPLKRKERELREKIEAQNRLEREISNKLVGLKEDLGKAKGERDSLRRQIKDIQEAKRELKKLEDEVSEKKLLEQAYEYLYSQVFHERGLPVILITRLLEEVEKISREQLGRLLPGFDIFLSADEKGQVDIRVFDGKTIRPLETYSGGERVILGFMLRLAIARVMTFGMRVFPPKYLIIDEGFGPLSADFRRAVLRALTELSAQYDQIMIISHMEDISEDPAFDSHVRVFKGKDGISHVEFKHVKETLTPNRGLGA
jgi:exonuclease SbcC